MPAVRVHGVDVDWVQFPAARQQVEARSRRPDKLVSKNRLAFGRTVFLLVNDGAGKEAKQDQHPLLSLFFIGTSQKLLPGFSYTLVIGIHRSLFEL